MTTTSKMCFYQTEGTELVAVNPGKLAFLSIVFNKAGQGREMWQNTKAEVLILQRYVSFFHLSLYSYTAESKFPLIHPRHSPVLCSLDFPIAIIKEENGSDASVFTTYCVVASDSLVGIQGAQIQLGRGWEKKIQFLFC